MSAPPRRVDAYLTRKAQSLDYRAEVVELHDGSWWLEIADETPIALGDTFHEAKVALAKRVRHEVMQSDSPEEVADHYRSAFGAELGVLAHGVSQDLLWLHVTWGQYQALFGEQPARVELLNDAAPFFFRIVQDVLLESVILAIARLLGPKASRGKANLCLATLIGRLPDGALRQECEALLADARVAGSFAEDWRNRHLAHRDLSIAVGAPVQPLASATRAQITLALEAMAALMNQLENHYRQTTMFYPVSDYFPGDAGSLLRHLGNGLRFQRERQERLTRGEVRPDDFNRPEG